MKKRLSLKTIMLIYTCIVIMISGMSVTKAIKMLAESGMDRIFTQEVDGAYIGIINLFNQSFPGEWSLEQDELMKGDRKVAELESYLDYVFESTGYYVGIFKGNTRIVSNIKDKSGERAGQITADATTSASVLQGAVYTAPEDISGNDVMAYYAPINDESGNAVGMFFVGVDRSIMNDNSEKLRSKSILILIAHLAFWLPITFLLLSIMLNPIKGVSRQMIKMSHKDFRLDASFLKIKSRTEIGEMVDSIKAMQNVIADMTQTVNNEAVQVNHVAEESFTKVSEVNSDMQEIAATTEEISAGMEETSAGAEQVVSVAQNISEEVKALSKKANEGMEKAETIADRAKTLLEETKFRREGVHRTMETSYGKIQSAMNDAKQIDQIKLLADTIGNIANQTKLLALNASIEAARAGDAGRGFSVVADEIQSLSVASSDAVQKIQEVVAVSLEAVGNLIETQETQNDFVAGEMTLMYDKLTETGQQYYEDAGYVSALVSNLEESSQHMIQEFDTMENSLNDMQKAIAESAEGSSEIANHVNNIAENVTIIVTSSQETKESAENLKNYMGQYEC